MTKAEALNKLIRLKRIYLILILVSGALILGGYYIPVISYYVQTCSLIAFITFIVMRVKSKKIVRYSIAFSRICPDCSEIMDVVEAGSFITGVSERECNFHLNRHPLVVAAYRCPACDARYKVSGKDLLEDVDVYEVYKRNKAQRGD